MKKETTNKMPVTLLSGELVNSKSLTGKDRSMMDGKLKFNDLECYFWCKKYSNSTRKEYTSEEEISEKMKRHTDYILTEDDTMWFYTTYDISIDGLDVASLKKAGIFLDYSQLYSRMKILINNDKLEYNKSYSERNKELYNACWYVKNLDEISKAIPDNVTIEISPTLEYFCDPEKTSNIDDVKYYIEYSYENEKSITHYLISNFSYGRGYHDSRKFTGFSLQIKHQHAGLFQTVKGIIKRIKKENDEAKHKFEMNNIHKNKKESKLNKLQLQIFSSIAEGQVYHSRERGRGYYTDIYELLFNVSHNTEKDITMSTGIKFTCDDDLKSFSIEKICGEYKDRKMFTEVFNIFMTYPVDDKFYYNFRHINITLEGMKKLVSFVKGTLLAKQISTYEWKLLKDN